MISTTLLAPGRAAESHQRAVLVVVALVLAVAGLVAGPAPQAKAATEIGSFPALTESTASYIDYIDYTMINASSSNLVVLDHQYADGRTLGGQELYDNTALAPGDYTEYASKGLKGTVAYRWAILGTKYQVQLRSVRTVERGDEKISCSWYHNGDYSRDQ